MLGVIEKADCVGITLIYVYLRMQVFSVSLFWTAAVLCNTVHVIVSGMVFLVLIHGGREAATMPSSALLKSLKYALTTSFGSICYGSLFTAAIRTLRWKVTTLSLTCKSLFLCPEDYLLSSLFINAFSSLSDKGISVKDWKE